MGLENNSKVTITGSESWNLNLNGDNTVVKCKAPSDNSSKNQTWLVKAVDGVENGYTLSITRSSGSTYYLSNDSERVSTDAFTWVIADDGSGNYTIADGVEDNAGYLTQKDASD